MRMHELDRQSLRMTTLKMRIVVFVGTLITWAVPDVHAQTPLTTREMRRIMGNPKGLVGIRYNQEVGMTFQKYVLAHLAGPKLSFAVVDSCSRLWYQLTLPGASNTFELPHQALEPRPRPPRPLSFFPKCWQCFPRIQCFRYGLLGAFFVAKFLSSMGEQHVTLNH